MLKSMKLVIVNLLIKEISLNYSIFVTVNQCVGGGVFIFCQSYWTTFKSLQTVMLLIHLEYAGA